MVEVMTTVQFREWTCRVVFDRYCHDNRTAILLVDVEDGSPVATATVNIPDEELTQGCCFIKDWSENEGMLEALVEAGIVEPTGRRVSIGFVEAIEAKILRTT